MKNILLTLSCFDLSAQPSSTGLRLKHQLNLSVRLKFVEQVCLLVYNLKSDRTDWSCAKTLIMCLKEIEILYTSLNRYRNSNDKIAPLTGD